MKIYIPKNNKIRSRIVEEVNGKEEFDYICNKNEYTLLRELSEEEFNSLDVHSEEHEPGNVLLYTADKSYILDGLGYFRVNFQ